MSKASGILLIAVGVGLAAYAMPFDSEKGEPAAQELSVGKAAVTKAVEPATPMAMATASKAAADIEPPAPKPAVKPTLVSAEQKSVTPGKSTVVAIVPRAVERPAAVALKSPPAVIPGDPVSLTRELQRELRRVGCYDGEINGSWTPASRRAMKVFTDRVNASLPTDRPDYILLRLVQTSQERVCAVGCPTGQNMSDSGRCLPDAVLAHAAKKPQKVASGKANPESAVATTSGWSTTTTVATRDLPVVSEGRMSLAGPSREGASSHRNDGQDGVPAVGAAIPGGVTEQAAQDRNERPVKTTGQRKSKFAAVENSGRRDESTARKKFGPWFFNQQDGWRN
jgi:hypothetical protein